MEYLSFYLLTGWLVAIYETEGIASFARSWKVFFFIILFSWLLWPYALLTTIFRIKKVIKLFYVVRRNDK